MIERSASFGAAFQAVSRVARKGQIRRSGSACRGGPALEDFQHDEIQPDGRGVHPPGDRPEADRSERARVGGTAARDRQIGSGGRIRPGRECREGQGRRRRHRRGRRPGPADQGGNDGFRRRPGHTRYDGCRRPPGPRARPPRPDAVAPLGYRHDRHHRPRSASSRRARSSSATTRGATWRWPWASLASRRSN